MSPRRILLLVILAAVVLGATPAAQGPARRAAYPAKFPAGPGQSIATRSCLVCHSAMLITQQHKDSTAWEKTVHQMEAWGVKTTPAEHDSLVGYLRASFGPKAK